MGGGGLWKTLIWDAFGRRVIEKFSIVLFGFLALSHLNPNLPPCLILKVNISLDLRLPYSLSGVFMQLSASDSINTCRIPANLYINGKPIKFSK